jgi:hypothetical protein
MRTASGYQAPAVPYHTPIVTDFSTPNLILPSGTRNILPTKKQRSREKSEVLWGMENTRIFLTATLFTLPLCASALKKTALLPNLSLT